MLTHASWPLEFSQRRGSRTTPSFGAARLAVSLGLFALLQLPTDAFGQTSSDAQKPAIKPVEDPSVESISAAETTTSIAGVIPVDRFVTSPGGVDLSSGNFTYSKTDVSIGGEAEPGSIALTRTGDNGKTHIERFGQFSHNWEIYVTESYATPSGLSKAGGTVSQISISGQGLSSAFRSGSPRSTYGNLGTPIKPSNAKLQRIQSGSSYYYKYVAADGTVVTFSTMSSAKCEQLDGDCAYATLIEKPNGVSYTLTYDNLGTMYSRLRSVVSNTGRGLVLEYATSGGKPYVSKACVIDLSRQTLPGSNICPVGAKTATYQYSGNFMTQVIDQASSTWSFSNTYTNATSDYTLSFYKPGNATAYLVNTYEQSYDAYLRTVKQQVFSDGPTYVYNYRIISLGDFAPGGNQVAGGSYSYNGQTVSAQFGAYKPPKAYNDNTQYVTAGPETTTDELGRSYYADYCVPYPSYGGCRPTALQSMTDPEGIKTLYNYDSSLNVTQVITKAKPNSGLADITRTATYDCSNAKACHKPTSVEDARHYFTYYVYDPSHGGVTRETGPAGLDGILPVKRYAYAQRYAWVKGPGGGYVQASTPVWLLTTEKTCRKTATIGDSCQGGSADEVVISYDYGPNSGPNTLALRGKLVTASGTSRRTCFGYDVNGDKIWEMSPRAGLGTCS